MIFLPEIRLKRVTDALLQYLKVDLTQNINNNTENKAFLYLLFHQDLSDKTVSINYKEAKSIFLRKESNPRYLKVSPVFDRRRAAVPTIHIVVPQDGEELRQIGDIEGIYSDENGYVKDKLGRAFQTQFNLITTSDNINEVIYINYVLRALFLGAIPILEAVGFIKPEFSTQDLNINPDLFPANAYMKGILMTAMYPEIVPEVQVRLEVITEPIPGGGEIVHTEVIKEEKPEINNIVFNINKIIY